MASTGATYGSSVSQGGGDQTWSNTGNVYADDAAYADVTLAWGNTSNILDVTGFGFALPAGATIDGVEVKIEGYATDATGGTSSVTTDNLVQLIKGGTKSGDDKSQAGDWNTSPTVRTYGGAADKWGLTLTEADVEASNFGIAFQVFQSPYAAYMYVDYLTINVFYTEAGGGGANVLPGFKNTNTFRHMIGR